MKPATSAIETMTGRFVNLTDPDPDTIDIHDIAWSLSRMPRYVGHTTSEIPLTIGEHSLLVMKLVVELFKTEKPRSLVDSFYGFTEIRAGSLGADPYLKQRMLALLEAPEPPPRLLLELLMHDASEAYLVDVPTPLKQAPAFREVYQHLEHQMTSAIRQALGLDDIDPLHEEVVKWADLIALNIEAYHLIASRGKNWRAKLPLDQDAYGLFDWPAPTRIIYGKFLDSYYTLARSSSISS